MFLKTFLLVCFSLLVAPSVSLPLLQGSTDSVCAVESLKACFLAKATYFLLHR